MKILFLTQILPYPTDAGPKMRAYYVLRQLCMRHDVHLVSFVRRSDPSEAFEHLKQLCCEVTGIEMKRSRLRDLAAMVASIIEQTPFLVTRDRSPEMNRCLYQLMDKQRFDAIHADQLWMAPYALLAQDYARAMGQEPHTVLDQHNAVFRIPQRMAANSRNLLLKMLLDREAGLMQVYEQQICSRFNRVVWVTAEDRYAVMPSGGDDTERQNVIPICIDTFELERELELSEKPVVLFVGGMHWPPNAEGAVWFVENVLPLVRERVPEARLLAIGKSPPKQIQKIDCIEAPGFVEDLEPYWQRSRAFVVPLLAGGGTRVKILDAWAHGLPVVSTTVGAEGIDYRAGEDILIADDPQEFAAGLSLLLKDDQFARNLAAGGRQRVEQRYDWKMIYPAWEEIYGNLNQEINLEKNDE